MEEIDAYMKSRNVMHCESAHFILTFNLPKVKVKSRLHSTHAGMHLYLERLEALYQDVIKDLGAEDKDFLAKTHVMIWEKEHEIQKSAAKYCHQQSNTKSYLLGAAPVFTLYYNRGLIHTEPELHQAVVHNVVHCLLSNVWNGIWPGNIKGGWLDAGYAHHYEIKYFGHLGGVRNYCYREQDIKARFEFGEWEPAVRKRVESNEFPSFLKVATKNTDTLDPLEHMFSWSYVDFILKKHPAKFGILARRIKERKPLVEVLKKSLGMTPFQFEEQWKGFVQESYSLIKKSPPAYIRGRKGTGRKG
jgi:hypothetical protein